MSTPTEEDVEVETEVTHTSSPYIDKLTLELMMNRSHYKKYLANTDAVRFQETQEKTAKIALARDNIREMTDTLLGEFIRHMHSTKYNTEVSDAFENYMNTCLVYLDDYPLHDTGYHENDDTSGGDDDDDNMLFPAPRTTL